VINAEVGIYIPVYVSLSACVYLSVITAHHLKAEVVQFPKYCEFYK